jgi:hypothetical protein
MLLLTPLIALVHARRPRPGDERRDLRAGAGGDGGERCGRACSRAIASAPGAALFLLSDLLLFAEMGPLQGQHRAADPGLAGLLPGPAADRYGVAQTLRKRDPELRIVVNN